MSPSALVEDLREIGRQIEVCLRSGGREAATAAEDDDCDDGGCRVRAAGTTSMHNASELAGASRLYASTERVARWPWLSSGSVDYRYIIVLFWGR